MVLVWVKNSQQVDPVETVVNADNAAELVLQQDSCWSRTRGTSVLDV